MSEGGDVSIEEPGPKVLSARLDGDGHGAAIIDELSPELEDVALAALQSTMMELDDKGDVALSDNTTCDDEDVTPEVVSCTTTTLCEAKTEPVDTGSTSLELDQDTTSDDSTSVAVEERGDGTAVGKTSYDDGITPETGHSTVLEDMVESVARRTRSRNTCPTVASSKSSCDEGGTLATLPSTVFEDNGVEISVDDMPDIPIPLLPPIDIKSSDCASSTLSTDLTVNDGSKDVIYARGAAAQSMTNPGNLYFYQLCNERYNEFIALEGGDPKRRIICEEIVDAILETGGKFRTRTGGVMKRVDARYKTRDRMFLIGKPKIRPTGFGPNDVVSARGAASHLYPGNAKWHDLLDGYVLSYVRDMDSGNAAQPIQRRLKNGTFAKGTVMTVMSPHRSAIVDETIRIIHERGGKFLDENLKELSYDEVKEKTHIRFRDLKKMLLAGKREFVPHNSRPVADRAAENGAGTASAFRKRLGGFTEAKVVVSSERELRALRKKKRAKMMYERKKRPKNCSKQIGKKYTCLEDDASFDSALLDSDGSIDSSDDGESAEEDEEEMKISANKQKQAEERAKRLERRRSGRPNIRKQQHQRAERTQLELGKKLRSNKGKRSSSPEPETTHSLSEYELKRLEKIRRNQAKLKELGLL